MDKELIKKAKDEFGYEWKPWVSCSDLVELLIENPDLQPVIEYRDKVVEEYNQIFNEQLEELQRVYERSRKGTCHEWGRKISEADSMVTFRLDELRRGEK